MKASERHRLKHDTYADTLAWVIAWARRHQTHLVTILLIVAVAIVGVIWAVASRRSTEDAAQTVLGEIENEVYAVRMLDPEAQAEAADVRVGAKADLLRAQYPDAAATPVALLRVAQLYATLGDFGKAVGYFRGAISSSPATPELIALARRGLANSLEAAGNLQEAIDSYGAIAIGSSASGQAEMYFSIGRCYAQLSDLEQAKAFYLRAVEAEPGGQWAALSRVGVDELGSTRAPGEALPTEEPLSSQEVTPPAGEEPGPTSTVPGEEEPAVPPETPGDP